VKHPASPQLQLLLVRAAQQHGSGDLRAAESSYRAALELEADQAMALAGLGALEGQRGHAAQAAQYLARACELEPQIAIFQHNHGEALRQLGQLAQAEVALRRAVELDQGLVPAWDSLIAMIQAAHGQAVGARDTRRAAMLATELSRMANNKGNAWLARGDLAQAIGAYRQALSIRPDYPLAWSNLGNTLRQAGQINEAEAACRRAIALDPEFAAAWNNLGNALIEQGR
jgi:tetratricopeptide (TPR) repeat protein